MDTDELSVCLLVLKPRPASTKETRCKRLNVDEEKTLVVSLYPAVGNMIAADVLRYQGYRAKRPEWKTDEAFQLLQGTGSSSAESNSRQWASHRTE